MNATKGKAARQRQVYASIDQLPTDLESRSESFLITLDAWREAQDHVLAPEKTPRRMKSLGERADAIIAQSMNKVTMALLNGTWYKLDGYRRDPMWLSGELPVPDDGLLEVQAYLAFSQRDLDHLFRKQEYPLAHAQKTEQLLAVMEKKGLHIRSKNLRFGYFAGAMNYAIRGCQPAAQSDDMAKINMDKALSIYETQIEALDDLGLKAEYFSTGVLAAALVSVTLHPESIDIWASLNENSWQHDPRMRGYDAAGVISQVITQRRGRVKQTRSPIGHQFMFRLCLAVVDEWAKKKAAGKTAWFNRPPKPVRNPTDYLEAIRSLNGLPFEMDLFQPPQRLAIPSEFFAEDLQLLEPPPKDVLDLSVPACMGLDPESREAEELVVALRFALHGKGGARQTTVSELRTLSAALANELSVINSFAPKRHIFTPGVLGAALASIRICESCGEIWSDLNRGAWRRSPNGCFDAPGVIYQMLLLNKDEHVARRASWDQEAFARSMMVVKTWIDEWTKGQEKTYKTTPRELANPAAYLEEAVSAGYTFA